MKIDWKYLATTPGYKSLKAAYIHDIRDAAKQKHPMREKTELLKKFNWVINRAKHHAYIKGVPISTILDFWEANRSYCWLNYYQDCAQPKLYTKKLKPMGIKGIRKSYKTAWYFDPAKTKMRVMEAIQHQQKEASIRTKPRWPKWRKR